MLQHFVLLSQLFALSYIGEYFKNFQLPASGPTVWNPFIARYNLAYYLFDVDNEHINPSTDEYFLHDSSLNLRATCTSTYGLRAVIDLIAAIKIGKNNPEAIYNVALALPSNSSCLIEDFGHGSNAVWLFADEVGQYPLFYSFSTVSEIPVAERVLITTDFLLGVCLGKYFTELSAVGPGQLLRIDLNMLEVDYVEQWNHPTARPYVRSYPRDLHAQYREFYMISLEALTSPIGFYRHGNSSLSWSDMGMRIIIESDPGDASSALQSCVMDSISLPSLIFHAKPLVGFVTDYHQDRLHRIVDVLGAKEGGMYFRTGSLADIAVERWELCEVAKRNNATLLAFDNGLKFRPIKTYFQNLFCELAQVNVIYPYANTKIQKFVRSLDFPASELNQIVDDWQTNGVCNPEGEYSASVRSVEYNVSHFLESPSEDHYDEVLRRVQLSSRHEKLDKNTVDENPSSRRPQSSRIGTLWSVANTHASQEGYLFVLLATSGYYEMLENYFCSVLSSTSQGSRHLLIITPDDDIAQLASSAGVGYFIATPDFFADQLASGTCTDSEQPCPTARYLPMADFGTLHYQELMLYRTRIVLELLLLGFQPIIADIDTVWKVDPLAIVRNTTIGIGMADLAVTDDHGEICGCFVVLKNTPRTIKFWGVVAVNHFNLVAEAKKNNSLHKFSDSEQKILTALLLEKRYTGTINVRMLPRQYFPSGFDYFNVRGSTASPPAIIHNNFIIGMGMKKFRFLRNNLWTIPPNRVNNSVGELRCAFDYLSTWSAVFAGVYKDLQIPSITNVLPSHNSVLRKGTHVMAQISAEKLPNIPTEAIPSTGKQQFWLSADPPTAIHFEGLGVYDLRTPDTISTVALSTAVENSNVGISNDAFVARDVFVCDRGGFHAEEAHEAVLQVQHHSSPWWLDGTNLPNSSYYKSCPSDIMTHSVNYTIKVIAFNRPQSLFRLLQSLFAADYCGMVVSLDVLIDGFSKSIDESLVQQTIAVAEHFRDEVVWDQGKMTVYYRDVNVGLASQWYDIFAPSGNILEAAFIFEDDNEVSPYFFKWAIKAVDKYYLKSPGQLLAHRKLLEAVRNDISRLNAMLSGITVDIDIDEILNYKHSHMYNFTKSFAGKPLLYGICLQKQHVDPIHYPKKLEVRNAHRPFLYSLIGSWGPLMFPEVWKAFREWWKWRKERVQSISQLRPVTERLVTNYFYRENAHIWTPWIVRFAYESGAKCLYSNLPGDLALVTNYRDAGSNYAVSLGKSSVLLMEGHFEGELQLRSGSISKNEHQSLITSLRRSFGDFPAMESLSTWQLDFHLRRIGSLGVDRPLASSFPANSQQEISYPAWQAERGLHDVAVRYFTAKSGGTILKIDHWAHIIGMLETVIHPTSTVVHIDTTPALLLATHVFYKHQIIHSDGSRGCGALDTLLKSIMNDHHIMSSVKDIIIRRLRNNQHIHCGYLTYSETTELNGPSLTILDIGALTTIDRPATPIIMPFTEYLLVVGPCASAPTDIVLATDQNQNAVSLFMPGHNGKTLPGWTATLNYTMIEDVCAEGNLDVGGILYRYVGAMDPQWMLQRHAVARRMHGSLVATRMIARKTAANFI